MISRHKESYPFLSLNSLNTVYLLVVMVVVFSCHQFLWSFKTWEDFDFERSPSSPRTIGPSFVDMVVSVCSGSPSFFSADILRKWGDTWMSRKDWELFNKKFSQMPTQKYFADCFLKRHSLFFLDPDNLFNGRKTSQFMAKNHSGIASVSQRWDSAHLNQKPLGGFKTSDSWGPPQPYCVQIFLIRTGKLNI